MDSERRHELETNDLREFLDNFKDFWDKHGNRLLIVLILVLGTWVGITQYNKYKNAQAEAAYTELNDADSVDAFRTIAGERSEVHDEAMRRGGDTGLSQARQALIDGDDEAAKSLLTKADSAYTALVDRGATVEYQLVGHEGLAKVAVMRKEWDKAAGHYESIIGLAGESFVAQAGRAQRAMDRIDLLKNPVAFAPPEIEPAPEGDVVDPVPALPPLPTPPTE
ncbi:MAG: tetratricopeptide repeat protein [Planctomycetota bacterium]